MNIPSIYIKWEAYTQARDGKVNVYRGLELRPYGGYVVVSYREDIGIVVDLQEVDFQQSHNALFIKNHLATATVFSSIEDAISSYEYDANAPTAPIEITA